MRYGYVVQRREVVLQIFQGQLDECTTVVLHLKWNTVFLFFKFYIKDTSH